MPHITISGDIGSGKSSVARELAGVLRYRLASVGDLQRSMAEARGLTTLEANRLAEGLPVLDDLIDQAIIDVSQGPADTIFDSRMAWYLLPSACKIHLIVDPAVAGDRLFRRRASRTESYASAKEAEDAAEARHQSERKRFSSIHGVDIFRLDNYDLVIDTSDATVATVVAEICAALATDWCAPTQPKLRVTAGRIKPLPAWLEPPLFVDHVPADLVVGYLRPDVFLLRPGWADVRWPGPERLMQAVLGVEGPELAGYLAAR